MEEEGSGDDEGAAEEGGEELQGLIAGRDFLEEDGAEEDAEDDRGIFDRGRAGEANDSYACCEGGSARAPDEATKKGVELPRKGLEYELASQESGQGHGEENAEGHAGGELKVIEQGAFSGSHVEGKDEGRGESEEDSLG